MLGMSPTRPRDFLPTLWGGDEEITITDKLLVTGKKPYSLAKFLSTSMVFRKTVGDAQLAEEVAFVKNRVGAATL